MKRHRKVVAATGFLAVGLLAASCGSSSTAKKDDKSSTTVKSSAAARPKDGKLVIGELLPETGSLAFLGPPEFAGVALAKKDIDEAGGVLGKPIEILKGDSGDTSTDIANQTTDKHLAAGADVILGAASSGVTKTVIDKIVNAGVIQFSPANTAPDFTTYKDNGLYFRTAPSDVLQGRVLSDLVAAGGGKKVGILARQDPYGQGLLKYTRDPLKEAKIDVTEVVYDPEAQNFDAEVDKIAGIKPDNVVVIGFDESAKILTKMIEKKIGPKDIKIWLVDGNIGNALGAKFASQPGALQGVKGSLPSAQLKDDFKNRLKAIDPNLKDYSYSGESYDAVIIVALAAEVAKSDAPGDIAKQINGVTKGGTKCTTYKECLALVKAGKDIDYDGIGGPYEFGDAGEPNQASFAIQQYGADNKIDDSKTEYKFAKIA